MRKITHNKLFHNLNITETFFNISSVRQWYAHLANEPYINKCYVSNSIFGCPIGTYGSSIFIIFNDADERKPTVWNKISHKYFDILNLELLATPDSQFLNKLIFFQKAG